MDPNAISQLLAQARAWAADDPDPRTRAEIEALVSAPDIDALRDRFSGPLDFGTAGLRGIVGAGPSRMNRATVARATAGVARQALADVPGAAERGVVVGRDGRRMSPELARMAAEILAGHGLRVYWFPEPAPTPVVAFAGRHLNAAATVIVTASHNPPEYNGFKVYSERGYQIVSPQDLRIRAEMDAAGPTLELPRVDFDEAAADGRIRPLDAGGDLAEAYLAALDTQCLGPVPPPAEVVCVTTALHGVGHRWVRRALHRRGFERDFAVEAQAEPDGRFPTVRFPNPEEKGALDLAFAEARAHHADLVVANDPDTDRLSLAVRCPAEPEGYLQLTGNQVGVLLADWLLAEGRRQGRLPERPLVLTTIVSTSMLSRVAAAHGARCEEVLTGFKWIWDRALHLEPEGFGFVFGFEEALGYCVGPAVRDKDGIGAAQVAMELTAALKARGLTLLDRLETLYREHGLHLTEQISTVLPGLGGRKRIDVLLAALRADPPTRIAGSAVLRARDLLGPDAKASGLPPGNVLTWWLEDGARLTFRPSGTEPKLKVYLEVRTPVDPAEALPAAHARAARRLDALRAWVRSTGAAPADGGV